MMTNKTAILLVNLGTPDAPTPSAVRRYLKQFLSDPRVVEVPRWLWFFILRLFILPFRPRPVARLYQSIWQQDSPIRLITARQAEALSDRLQMPVIFAMNYGHPGLHQRLNELRDQGVERLLVLPMYPQYSGSTSGAVADALADWTRQQREVPELLLVKDYWQEDGWQAAVASSIERYWEKHGRAEKLLFSFHGIPLRYQQKGDRYPERCVASAKKIAARLGLEKKQWCWAFQSRLGNEPWVRPYTDVHLREWAEQGIGHVQVICPGFAADCLETLEEIAERNKKDFISAGGKKLEYIPALNTTEEHLDALEEICRKKISAWQ